jgi:hypothetical protein
MRGEEERKMRGERRMRGGVLLLFCVGLCMSPVCALSVCVPSVFVCMPSVCVHVRVRECVCVCVCVCVSVHVCQGDTSLLRESVCRTQPRGIQEWNAQQNLSLTHTHTQCVSHCHTMSQTT